MNGELISNYYCHDRSYVNKGHMAPLDDLMEPSYPECVNFSTILTSCHQLTTISFKILIVLRMWVQNGFSMWLGIV